MLIIASRTAVSGNLYNGDQIKNLPGFPVAVFVTQLQAASVNNIEPRKNTMFQSAGITLGLWWTQFGLTPITVAQEVITPEEA